VLFARISRLPLFPKGIMRNFRRYNRAIAKRYDQWMIAMHYAKTTQALYKRCIQRYIEFIGDRSIANVNHTQIQGFVARVSEDGASLSAVYRDLGILRQFYDFLHLGGLVNYVAPRFVRLRRPWWNSPAPLTEHQVHKLLSTAKTLHERAMVEFLYSTGCRLGETLRLKAEDIDFDTRSARVRGKFGKVRLVLFTRTAAEVLSAYLAGRKKGYVFQQDRPPQKGCVFVQNGAWKSRWRQYGGHGRRGRCRTKNIGSAETMSYEAAKKRHEELIASLKLVRPVRNRPLSNFCAQNLVRRLALHAGLKRVTPHTLRRTFATHLYDHGASIDVIKVLLGHVWIQTTMKYARLSPDRLAKTFNQCHPREVLNEQPPQ
jgi:site-specific recombinase XerD